MAPLSAVGGKGGGAIECRISGLSRILFHGLSPAAGPGPIPAPPDCFMTRRLRAIRAKNTIAAIPIVPRTMPIPAAAPLLRPALLPSVSVSFTLEAAVPDVEWVV